MKNIFTTGLMALVIATILVACKKDDSCSVSFPINGAFVHDWGETVSAVFETSNVATVSVTASNGWTASANLSTHTLTVTAPENEEVENAAKTSTVTISAVSPGGKTSSASLYAYIVDETVDLSADGTANCYVVTKPDTKYKFDVTVKGESGDRLATASVGVAWMSNSSLVRYLTFDKDGYAEFYVDYASDSDTELREGNALIAAYNDAGEIIWSWHLWLTNSDPRTEDGVATYSNGETFMGRNLGSYTNSDGSTDTDEILESYGLYYQWGRKEPFPRPRYYNCANNLDSSLYDGGGSYVYVSVEETSAATGTMAYAIANPVTFISAPDGNNGNWLYGGSDDTLWGSGSSKGLYDPCPKGWCVPGKDAFTVLDIADEEDQAELETAKKTYGWALTDTATGQKYFYTGAGYRSYMDGIISNVNYKDEYPYTPMPWVGYYWTAGTDGTDAVAMFFDLNTSRAVINGFNAQCPEYRANAMQIRCVKVK